MLSLAALLTVGRHTGEQVVLILFGVMVSSAALVVANCYGIVGLLRLLGLALVAGLCLAAVTTPLPGWLGEALSGVVVPFSFGVLLAVRERRKRHRRRVVVLTTNF
jgi:hypothetical protein